MFCRFVLQSETHVWLYCYLKLVFLTLSYWNCRNMIFANQQHQVQREDYWQHWLWYLTYITSQNLEFWYFECVTTTLNLTHHHHTTNKMTNPRDSKSCFEFFFIRFFVCLLLFFYRNNNNDNITLNALNKCGIYNCWYFAGWEKYFVYAIDWTGLIFAVYLVSDQQVSDLTFSRLCGEFWITISLFLDSL